MPSKVAIQAALLQRILKDHRDEWFKQFQSCQPSIAPSDKAPSFLRFLGSQFNARHHLIFSNVRELEVKFVPKCVTFNAHWIITQ
jgi:hypothetical protein